MPLPLIPFLAAAGVAGAALYTRKKYSDTKEAGKYHSETEEVYDVSAKSLDANRKTTQRLFEILGNMQAKIVRGNLKRYRYLMKKLEIGDTVEFQKLFNKETLSALSALEDSIVNMTTILSVLSIDKVDETMIRFGIFGYDGLLMGSSTANTGSFSGLSKKSAAKTAETAAWFRLKNDDDVFVVEDLEDSPVLQKFMRILESDKENKRAKAYYASVVSLTESMGLEEQTWKAFANLAAEKMASLEESDSLLHDKIAIIDFMIRQKGTNLETWEQNELAECKDMLQLAQTLVNDIDVPIMHDTDTLTLRLQEQQRKTKQIIEEINLKWGEKESEPKTKEKSNKHGVAGERGEKQTESK